MKKILFFVLLLLVACAPAAQTPPKTTGPPSGEPSISTQEEVTSPPQSPPSGVTTTGNDEEPLSPMEPSGSAIDPYSELGCGQLLTAKEFAEACGKDPATFLVTHKIGTDKSVGERAYTFPKVDRQIINFVRNQFIVEVGADNRLCSKEDLLNVARVVDSNLR